MGFPEAKLHDNLNKAYQMFEDALNIRTAESYPLERALTLINLLELYWIMHNKDSEEEVRNYNTMLDKAHEIKQLVKDKTIMNQADEHIEALYDLKKVLH